MLRLFIAVALICIAFFLISSSQPKRQFVVVFGPTAAVEQQLAQWKDATPEFNRRGIAILKSSEINEPDKAEKKLSIAHGSFAVVLVGKDGHSATRSSAPVSAAALCEMLDSMPTRLDDSTGCRSTPVDPPSADSHSSVQ